MRIAFLGTGAFGVPALRALREAGHEIVRAVSQPDRPAGRGKRVQPTPVRAACDALGVPHVQTDDVNSGSAAELIGSAELGVVVAFGQKLGSALLATPARGFVNIHASLLPKLRGAAPIQWAILNGDDVTGVTVFQLNERWDAGAIWGRRTTPIGETETASELHDRLAELGAELICKVLAAIHRGSLSPIPQEPEQATRAPKLTADLRRVDFSQPARRVARWINGLWAWPAATCVFRPASGDDVRVQLARAEPGVDADAPTDGFPPGALRPDGRVQTGAGCVRILEIQPAGRSVMKFEAFRNGRDVTPPARFLPIESP